jgi:hypothetical protein
MRLKLSTLVRSESQSGRGSGTVCVVETVVDLPAPRVGPGDAFVR